MPPITLASPDVVVASDCITLNLQVKNSGVYRFSISSSNGGKLYQQTFIQLQPGAQELQIPLPHIDSGAYLLQVFNIHHKISFTIEVP